MLIRNVGEASQFGMCVGVGLAVAPAAATLLIAGSKVILINMIANTILLILTAGMYQIHIPGSLIELPLLWKFSMISAMIGGVIFTLSLAVYLANAIYLRACR